MRPAAVIFDFNGTISDDEGLLAELFERIFGEVGIEVPASLYFEQFAGYADDEICRLVLERFGRSGEPGLQEHLVERRAQLYMEAQRTRSTVRPQAADCVRQIAARVPVAIASGAARVEIEGVLESSGLRRAVPVLVCLEDVQRGKPDPQSYLIARDRARRPRRTPAAGRSGAGLRGLRAGPARGAGRGDAVHRDRGHRPGRTAHRRSGYRTGLGLVYTTDQGAVR